jgi:hypothetical protein
MTEAEHPFKPGLEVAIVNRHFGFSMRRATIAKVHKTGRFTLVGDERQQWSPSRFNPSTAWRAAQAWDQAAVELITPELLAEEAAYALVRRGWVAIERLSRPIKDEVFTLEVVERLEALVATILRRDVSKQSETGCTK